MKQAFADLVADPAKVYDDFISGVLPEGTTRAAYALALMKSDFVLSNPSRMDMVARAFFKGNTRIAQELQSIKVFGRMDYLNIVGRFSAQADELLKKRGVDVEKEASKLLKQFNSELDEISLMSKEDAVKALDLITCKV
jgi:putative cell wall-binding protein